ncbi:hypothetical protein SDRG_08579 [Saprolegnia diclina VS20]|uniref:Uncharacterized protein n=1 Tax=Saprolegnia diclina (strain VS20) TaxID=1156394 RepID=T0Q7P8_SAPDV|nr:hypothetical protein SDRG_08579 [Saprolegnia diclina VS20]EQC33899.1 hypothetical protein SDRG_08579 [Saprolegnia diclina VS20]|eukprot:XP_008612694.1 hypothetical protein SDRG_08579 [Saprolegnia diclina VS20]
MTAAALLSFAATERVHAHLPVVAALDDKHAQLMTLLAAHLPVPDCKAALHPLTLGDLVLSIEAAQLHTPLGIVLALLHIDDSYRFCHAIHTWHDASATLQDAGARLQTLNVLVDTTLRSLRTVDHEPTAIAALHTALASSSCACLHAHLEPSRVVASSRGLRPHATPLQDVLDLVVRVATSYSNLCQSTHKKCPSVVLELPPLETFASVDDAMATSYTDELPGHEMEPRLEEWWPRATSTTDAQDATQSFARLIALGSAQWSTTTIMWLQTYLAELTDLDRLSIAVECICRQPPFAAPDVSASVAKAFNTLTTDHRKGSLAMLLRCVAWAPESVLHRLLQNGVACPEHVPVYLRLLELAPSLAQSTQLLPSLGHLVQVLTTETLASTAHLFAELTSLGVTTMLDVVGTCILPHLRGVNDLGWDLLTVLSPWTSVSDAEIGAELLDRTCATLATAWASTGEAQAAARLLPIARNLAAVVTHPTISKLEAYVTSKDIRLVLLLLPLFPSTPLPLPTLSESTDGVYTLSKADVGNIFMGALLLCASAVALLPSLATSLRQGRLAVAGVPACPPMSMLALLSTWVLPSLATSDDGTRFVFELLPQLLPPDQNTPLDATLCVARGMLLRGLATKSSWDRTSMGHVLHCIEHCIVQDPSSVSTYQGLLPLVLWLLRETPCGHDDDVLLMTLRKMTRAWHDHLPPETLGELHAVALELLSKNVAPTKTIFRHVHSLLTQPRRTTPLPP